MYLARDIPAFVMYCIHGESRSSLLIDSTDSMIPKGVLCVPVNQWTRVQNICKGLGNVLTQSNNCQLEE